jgi:predicted dehydrogenase
MVCKVGAVGLGHWFLRLCSEMQKDKRITITRTASIEDYRVHEPVLSSLGLAKESYCRMGLGEEIPKEFLDSVDIVYISSPNKYHANQTIQALSAGKTVVTEKTLGVTEAEFNNMIGFIRSRGYERKVYLHLHYMSKSIVRELPRLMNKFTNEHGKIVSFRAVFWNEDNEIDRRRADWLLKPENGGIFMDIIHPYEILFFGAAAKEVHIKKVQLNLINKDYSAVYPSGVDVEITVSGQHFKEGAQGTIRVGMGFPRGYGEKKMEFILEDGSAFYISFVSYEAEQNRVQMPYWELISRSGGKEEVIDFGRPGNGEDSEATTLISSMVKLYEGKEPNLTLDEAAKIFGPQWEYQRLSKGMKPVELRYMD